MNFVNRRKEIISFLCMVRSTTGRELAERFEVTDRTIRRDIFELSFGYPIYTKPGAAGGIFLMDTYKPYINTLTVKELEVLCDVYKKADGEQKEMLCQIIKKYGPDKLKLIKE